MGRGGYHKKFLNFLVEENIENKGNLSVQIFLQRKHTRYIFLVLSGSISFPFLLDPEKNYSAKIHFGICYVLKIFWPASRKIPTLWCFVMLGKVFATFWIVKMSVSKIVVYRQRSVILLKKTKCYYHRAYGNK